jgi:hypothetical protein
VCKGNGIQQDVPSKGETRREIKRLERKFDDHNGYVPTVIILIGLFAPIFVGFLGLVLAVVIIIIGWAWASGEADRRKVILEEIDELEEQLGDE